MKAKVIKSFDTAKGTIPVGQIINIPDALMEKLEGYVVPIVADTYRPDLKAWLTAGGELRSSGLIDDLAGTIVKLTGDNLAEQKRLLLLHCEAYDKHHIWRLWELWEERAAIMEHDGGLSREEAERQAAECLNLLAFLPELKTISIGDHTL